MPLENCGHLVSATQKCGRLVCATQELCARLVSAVMELCAQVFFFAGLTKTPDHKDWVCSLPPGHFLFVPFLSTENSEKAQEMLQKFHDFQRKAEMYYVYHSIQRYTVRAALCCKTQIIK